MISIVGAVIFGIIAVMTVLVTCGLPLGEFTMGGRYKVLSPKMRIASGLSVFIQVFAIMVILQTGEIVSFGMSPAVARTFCFLYAAYLSFNIIMNLLSNSKKEKFVMTPLSFITAICFWITAFNG